MMKLGLSWLPLAGHNSRPAQWDLAPETVAVQNRWTGLGTRASAERIAALDSILIRPLKTTGLFAKLRCLYTAQHSELASPINLIFPSEASATLVNSPTIVPNNYFQGDGASSFFRTPINLLTDGGVYQQNSASMFFWSFTDAVLVTASGTDIGNSTSARTIARSAASTGLATVNGGSLTLTSLDSLGLILWTRRNSLDAYHFRNGVLTDTVSAASTAIASAALAFGSRNGGAYSSRKMFLAGAGGALSDADNDNLFDILDAWKTYLGAAA